ncbi:DEAD/DEAH box helicase [Cellulomonas citrea]|uniref:DEAD/DEAH box helicase n=1 Tax=Cellulomonas citrea TaxID=1909423 RepID=UPI00135BFD3B|nr:DEAD/DEAH box helicase [Cellulomonas citrea]
MHIPAVSEDQVRRLVGAEAFARGLAYALDLRAHAVSWDESRGLLRGRVRGSAREVYTQHIVLKPDGEPVTGMCTCPVQHSCKHVAALLLQAAVRPSEAALAPEPDPSDGDPEGADLPAFGRAGAATASTGSSDANAQQAGPTGMATSSAGPSGTDSHSPGSSSTGIGAAGGHAQQAAWAQVLDSVLTPRRHSEPRHGAPLALLLEVQLGAGEQWQDPPRAHRLAVRPALRSEKGTWVRTGAGWSNVTVGYSGTPLDRDHREGLVALHRLIETTAGPRSWTSTPTWLYLDRGPGVAVWAMLAELRRIGVELLTAAAPNRAVTVHDEPAQVQLDLHEDGSGLQVLPGVLVDGTRLDPERLGLVGLPGPVGVYWWTEGAGGLELARFAQPLDRRAEALLTMPGTLRVPTPTADVFWGSYAPRLSTVLPLASVDGTVRLPEPAVPGLRLDIAVRERHTVDVGWSWAYRVDDGQEAPAAVPLGPIDRATEPWRSPDGEAALLATAAAAVAGALAPGGSVADAPAGERKDAHGGADRLRDALLEPLRTHRPGTTGLTDWDTVTLVDQVLPALREVEGVEVHVVGDLPDYREAATPARVLVGTGSGTGLDDGTGMDPSGRSGVGTRPGADAATGTDGEEPTLGSDRDWFELQVTIEVEDRQVPLEPVLRALVLGEDRVLLDDGLWLRVDTPQLAALRTLVEEARALGDDRRGPLRVSRFDVGAWDELVALGVVVQQAAAWTEAVERLAELADPPSADEVPAQVKAQLRPYQRAGYAWLRRLAEGGLGGILADDMGLGKTLQLLTFAAWLRAQPAGQQGPLLVVAPTSVVGAWAGEAARFVPDLVVRTVEATAGKRGSSLAEVVAGADVVVTSYTLFRLEFAEYERLTFSALVLDEAQTVKNHQSRAYACARTLRVPIKVAVTGTPLENSVLELWALLGLVAPGLFPSLQRFTEHYRVPIERDGDTARLADLRRRIRPLVLRRTKEQVAADLPARLEHVVEVELAPRHRALYDRYLARERQKVLGLLEDFDGNRFEIFRSLTLLRRLALDPSLVDEAHTGVPASKLDHLAAMLDEIVADGHRVLVFSQFTGVLGRVRDRLDAHGTGYAYLDGATTGRPAVIESFRTGDVPVFLISLRAGGVGLTLTEADYVVLLDPWWNPAVEAQAVDRAHRIGQTKQVMVYRLVAAGTIEDKVMALKDAKARLFDSVLGGGELADARLSAGDVRALLG